jgi:hypothetical protein
MPRSNDDVAVPAPLTPEIVKPFDVVGVEPLIPIVAAETSWFEAVANWTGVADESPYALRVSVRPTQPVPPATSADPAARPSTPENETVEK